jgi:hypothetical protein
MNEMQVRRWEPAGYVYRRPLGVRERLIAALMGAAAGLVVFYVGRLLLERTPLVEGAERAAPSVPGTPRREPTAGPTRA